MPTTMNEGIRNDDNRPTRGIGRFVLPALMFALPVAASLTMVGIEDTVAPDSVVFLRYARTLAGERAAPDIEPMLKFRGPEAQRVLRGLAADRPWVAALIAEHQHPGFPALVAAVHSVAGPLLGDDQPQRWTNAGRAVSVVGGGLLALGVFLLGRRLFGTTSGIVAAVMAALSPGFLRISSHPLSDAPATAMLVFAATAGVNWIRNGRTRDALWCGVFSAIGYWFRPEAAAATLIAAVVLLKRRVFGSPLMRPSWSHLAALVIPVAAAALPYMMLRGVLLTKKAHLLRDPPATTAAGDPVERLAPCDVCVDAICIPALPLADLDSPPDRPLPARVVKGCATVVVNWAKLLGIFGGIPLVIGFARCWPGLGRNPERWYLGTLVFANVLGAAIVLFPAVGYMDQRHILPAVAVTLPWLWPGLIAIVKMFGRANRRRNAAAIAVIGLVTLGAWSFTHSGGNLIGHREAGHWLREHLSPRGRVLDVGLVSAYLAGADDRNVWDRHPVAGPAHLSILLEVHRGVEFVVLPDATAEPAAHSMRQLVPAAEFTVSGRADETMKVRVYRVRR